MTFNELTRFGKNFSNPHTQVRWGGGGGDQTSVTSSGIAEEFKPDLKNLLGNAKNEFDQGDLSNVAGSSNLQNTVFGNAQGRLNAGLGSVASGQDTAYDAAKGQGMFGRADTTALKQAATRDAQAAFSPVRDAEANAGLIGGSRQAMAQGDREAQMAGTFAGIDMQADQERRSNALNGMGGLMSGGQAEAGINQGNLSSLAGLGEMQRNITQEVMDSDALGLERYSNVFGALTGGQSESTTTQTGGGK